MSITTTVEAALKLGLPLLALSWLLFNWLFTEGELERDTGHKAMHARLKKMKSSFRKKTGGNTRYLYDKWGWFGGGFYGLAGLWTFLVIEVNDFTGYLMSGRLLEPFAAGWINFFINFLIQQLANSIQALVWFSYWPGAGQSILLWVVVAYLCYWAGIEAARRELTLADLINSTNRPRTE